MKMVPRTYSILVRRIATLCLSLLLLACGQPEPTFRNTDITGAAFGRRLDLTDHDGRARRLEDFRGKAIVLFFGYTSCPDVCPTTLSKLSEVMKALGPQAEQVQVLFVTLDPERDTAARLKQFVPWFHPAFLGLYGSRADTDAAAKEFKIYSTRREGGGLGYTLDHSSGAYAFDPAGRLRLHMADGAPVEDIAADLRLLLAGR